MKYTLILLVVWGLGSVVFAQDVTVKGKVYDPHLDREFSGVLIGAFNVKGKALKVKDSHTATFNEQSNIALSNANGKFHLGKINNTFNDTYRISLNKIGGADYTFDIKLKGNSTLDLVLPLYPDLDSSAPLNTKYKAGNFYFVLAPAKDLEKAYKERKSNISGVLFILAEYCRADVVSLEDTLSALDHYKKELSEMQKELNFKCGTIIPQ
jgi:hypothetical protein